MESIYVSDRDLAKRFKTSRGTIWRWPATRGFPAPVKLSPGCTRWKLCEVESWEAGQPRYRCSSKSLPDNMA